MPRETWVWRDGALVLKTDDTAPPRMHFVQGDYEGYVSPASGKYIEGRYQHREDLKRTGCRILETGESRDPGKKLIDSYNANLRRILGDD